MHFAVLDRQAIDAEREELLHAVLPARVYARLARLIRGALHEIELRPIQHDLPDQSPVKQFSPLDREIDLLRREERHGDLPRGTHHVRIVNGVRTAPEIDVDVPNFAAIAGDLAERSIDVIPN